MKYIFISTLILGFLTIPAQAQESSQVSVRVVNEAQASQHIAGDKTLQYEQRYNAHNVKDLLLSEAIIVGVEFMAVVAFTMIYLDVTRRRRFTNEM
jgi:hypothetical protein